MHNNIFPKKTFEHSKMTACINAEKTLKSEEKQQMESLIDNLN